MVIVYLLVGILLGGFLWVLAILLLRRFLARRVAPFFEKAAELRKMGTRIEATVTRIEPYPQRTFPKQIYILVAQWQQPQTGRVFTYQGRTTNLEKFPIGSSILVLIDPHDPAGLYLMVGLQEKPDRFSKPNMHEYATVQSLGFARR